MFGFKTSHAMLLTMYVLLIMTLFATPAATPYFAGACLMAAVIGFSASIIEEAKKRKLAA